MGDKVNIKSRRGEFSTKVEIEGNKYFVQTEDMGDKARKIVTRTYFNGEIIHSVTTDYASLGDSPDLRAGIADVMGKQHEAALSALSKEEAKPAKTKARCAEEIQGFIRKGNLAAALEAVNDALGHHAADLFFLSYYGYLIAAVQRKTREGQKICEDTIKALSDSASTEKVFFYPLFYLNLGRALTAGNRKKEAIGAFQDGLKYDSRNKELLAEIKKFGVRKPPVISFLDRSHLVNRQLGKLRQRLTSR
jgi:tetratricopeptide (TPR) repeat protein